MEREPDKLQKFRDSLEKTNERSQDNFEKQLSYLAGGGIGVTVAFIPTIIKMETAQYKEVLFLGWFLLILTLFANLYSHVVSFQSHSKTIYEIDTNQYEQVKAVSRNRKINNWNKASIISLVLGIAIILIFITINLIAMSKEIQTKPNNPNTSTRGLQSSTPPPSQPKPSTGNQSPTPPPTNPKR